MEADLSSSSISNNNDKEELLKSAKVKMEEVREENERLKKLLAQIVKEYNSLENQISSMTRSEASSETQNSTDNHKLKEGTQERDLISLSLGSWNNNSEKRREDRETKAQSSINNSDNSSEKRRKVEEGLELGLDCRFEQYTKTTNREVASESVNNSTTMDDSAIVVKKEEDAIANWPPSRDLKAKEAGNGREKDEESLHQPQVKKTRVCIRSRCDSPTVHDGCQWRKYGQKIAKGNPCPRAYYRCTVSSNCPVRKQVQRCPQDMSILITTYEGNHNHPLPLSATAMASATTAAAAMLKTGSLTSHHQQQYNNNNHLATTSSTLPTTSSYGLHASNLITTFNNNPSMITAASHNSHPTVTLDLTTANPDYSPFSWPFNSASSSSSSSRNSSSFLNFSSSPSNNFSSLDFGANNNNHNNNNGNISRANSGFLGNYGTLFPNNSTNINNNDISKSIYQSLNSHHQALNETIAAAATKAIASNPNFQSVLEAAISSYVGSNNNNNNNSINNVYNNNNNNNNNVNNNNISSASEGGSLALFPASTSSMKNNSSNASGDTRDSST